MSFNFGAVSPSIGTAKPRLFGSSTTSLLAPSHPFFRSSPVVLNASSTLPATNSRGRRVIVKLPTASPPATEDVSAPPSSSSSITTSRTKPCSLLGGRRVPPVCGGSTSPPDSENSSTTLVPIPRSQSSGNLFGATFVASGLISGNDRSIQDVPSAPVFTFGCVGNSTRSPLVALHAATTPQLTVDGWPLSSPSTSSIASSVTTDVKVPNFGLIQTCPLKGKAKPAFDKLYDTIVKIHFANDSDIYRVHKGLVCHYSRYFRTAFRGGFIEEVFLPSKEKTGFAVFMEWVYTGLLGCDDDLVGLMSSATEEKLLTGYVFAEAKGIPHLKNAIIDLLVHQHVDRYFLPCHNLQPVWDGTLEKDGIRQLIVDFYTRNNLGLTDYSFADWKQRFFPTDLLWRLVKAYSQPLDPAPKVRKD